MGSPIRRAAALVWRLSLQTRLVVAVTFIVLAFGGVVVFGSLQALREARVDASEAEVMAIARGFDGGFVATDLDDARNVAGQIRQLVAAHPAVIEASVYRERRGRPERVFHTSVDPARVKQPGDPVADHDVAPLHTKQASYHEESEDGRHVAEVNFPLGPPERPVAALGLYFDLAELDAQLAARERWLLGATLAIGLLVALFTGLLLRRAVFGPLRRLQAATRRIRSGESEIRLRWGRRDELGRLSQDFDLMAEAVEERERLEELALTDPLTGLANHRHFHETLEVELHRASMDGTAVGLAMLDLDFFKHVNDGHGHPFGDQILCAVAEELDKLVRTTDVVARLGGEEFALLLPGADPLAARDVAEVARRAVARVAATHRLTLTCSAGVAAFPANAGDATTLIEYADGALYWAKDAGRDQVRVYDPHRVSTATSAQRRAEILAVLEDPDAIKPVFQPLVDVETGEIAGFEALARFPETEIARTPDVWIAEAHRCGVGPDVEAQALRAALAQPGRPKGTFLSLNLSPSAACTPQVAAALPRDLSGIVIELTEHESWNDEDGRLARALDDFRSRGARIAVDDAGAGYAGLQQVMRLRPDIIKLDRDLVRNVHCDAARAALIECFVTFARRTDAEVCAEGLEEHGEIGALSGLGVTYAQGYALARPAAAWPGIAPSQLGGGTGGDVALAG